MKKRNESEEGYEWLFGVHPVAEAVASRRRWVERILVAREGGSAKLGRLLHTARQAGITVTHLPREVLKRKAGLAAANQGIAAVVSTLPYADPDELSREAARDPDATLLVLRRIEDPMNLGAILRTAAGAGVTGVIIGGSGSVGLTPTVAKASAGAVERIPVAREPHLRARLESLRRATFRVVALDPRGRTAWDEVDLGGRVAVVAGGEGRGLGTAIEEVSDYRVAIPLAREIDSLNVSVAVGVLLFERMRQKRGARNGSRT